MRAQVSRATESVHLHSQFSREILREILRESVPPDLTATLAHEIGKNILNHSVLREWRDGICRWEYTFTTAAWTCRSFMPPATALVDPCKIPRDNALRTIGMATRQ